MNPPVAVAIVTPLFKARRHIQGWAESLAAQDHPIHVFAVDDACPEDSGTLAAAALTQHGIPHTSDRLPHNGGPGAARNRAFQHLLDHPGPPFALALLIDADTRPTPGLARGHAAFLRRHPQTFLLGGSIVGRAQSWIGKADGHAAWYTSPPRGRARPLRHHHVSSNNLSIRTSVLANGLRFDPRLGTGEDLALCLTAWRNGWALWQDPALVAHHIDRETAAEARVHHTNWGRHGKRLWELGYGGYFAGLRHVPSPLLPLLRPGIALATTTAVLLKQGPAALPYLPGVAWLKWCNAGGVIEGFRD